MPRFPSAPPLVCIVDDDDPVRAATENLVQSVGYRVQSFPSAEAFLAAAPLHADCLICDVRLPGMTGEALLYALRARGQSVPVIFVSAGVSDRLRGLAASDILVLAKPFASADLIPALRRLTGQQEDPV